MDQLIHVKPLNLFVIKLVYISHLISRIRIWSFHVWRQLVHFHLYVMIMQALNRNALISQIMVQPGLNHWEHYHLKWLQPPINTNQVNRFKVNNSSQKRPAATNLSLSLSGISKSLMWFHHFYSNCSRTRIFPWIFHSSTWCRNQWMDRLMARQSKYQNHSRMCFDYTCWSTR